MFFKLIFKTDIAPLALKTCKQMREEILHKGRSLTGDEQTGQALLLIAFCNLPSTSEYSQKCFFLC